MQPLKRKIFRCVKCTEPCYETIINYEGEWLMRHEGEVWLLCDECLEALTPSLDLLVPRQELPVH